WGDREPRDRRSLRGSPRIWRDPAGPHDPAARRPRAGLSVAGPRALLQAREPAAGDHAGAVVPARGARRDGAGYPCRDGGGGRPGGVGMTGREAIYAALFERVAAAGG